MTTQAPPALGLAQIGQIAITTKDLDRAVAFYGDTLGMRFLFRAPNLAFFDCGGVRLMLSNPEGPEFDHPASIIYYKVDDLQDAYDTLALENKDAKDGEVKVQVTGPLRKEGDRYTLEVREFTRLNRGK